MERLIGARVSVLAAGALASVALFLGCTVTKVAEESPRWDCAAEDEVVVIDNTCQHIDMLTHEDLRQLQQEGVKP